jgi:hypothetical protein
MRSPPAGDSSLGLAGRGAAPLALLLLAVACAGPDAPWDVAQGDEARFQRTERECRMLTQDAEGKEGPISFDRCMNRRGFERMGPIKRWLRGV